MPQFIQIASCGPPTGGVTEYLTGPVTWSCDNAWLAGPLCLAGGCLHGCRSAADARRDDLGTSAAAAGVVAAAAGGVPDDRTDDQRDDGADRPDSDQVASFLGALLLSAHGRDPLAPVGLLALLRVWHRTPGVCSSPGKASLGSERLDG